MDPKHRCASLQDMQSAPSMATVLWDQLSEKKVEPGFVPNVSRGRGGVSIHMSPEGWAGVSAHVTPGGWAEVSAHVWLSI